MSSSVPNSSPDVQKRRSSRIVQAVPLLVTGVDALGRPFQERTSTLIINCHGCRYQSKHYVLKNMWLTLEVPHPDPSREARSVRARVMWIRRPHTVRELFQVGVELEVPGNLWGIAFPPPDWFPFPEGLGVTDLPAPAMTETPPAAVEADQDLSPTLVPDEEQPEDNVRTMPLNAASDPSLQLARQMARLLNEARQQLHAMARESAVQAVTSEARPLMAALQKQMSDAAKASVEAATEQAVRGALDHTAQAGEEQLRQLREYWDGQLRESVEQASRTLGERVAQLEQERRAGFSRDLEAESARAAENLHRLGEEFQSKLAEAQAGLNRLAQQAPSEAPPAYQELEQRLQNYSEQAQKQFAEFEQAARQRQEQLNAAADSAQASWHGRLEADLQAAEARWDERVETSIESAVRQAADRLTRRTQETAEQIERETGLRIAGMTRTLVDASAEAEARLASVRGAFDAHEAHAQAALSQLEGATREVEEQAVQLEAVQQAAVQEMERRASALLDAQSQELSRRAEAALGGWTASLQPTLESAGREIVARLGAELEREFGAHFERVGQALGQLESGTRGVEEALRRHESSLNKVSEQSIQAALAHMQGSIGRLERDFEESGRAAAAKWLAEIDNKATETTHTTFESLFKTSEWYEKKVHTQMQASLEKGLELASDGLREKAGEMSRMFAAEMDHYSRSYVEHTGGQIEEAAREAVEGVRKQSAEMSATSASAIAQQTQNQTNAALTQFREKAGAALGQASSQFEALAQQARARFDTITLQSQEGFRAALVQDTQNAVRSARQDLAAQAEAAKQDVRSEGQRTSAQLQQTLGGLGDQAIESYRKRLESASNTWLLTTVSKLSQQSQEQLDALARAADARLRETCTQVFSNVGESLRRRLLDLAPQATSDAPPEKSPAESEQK